MEAGKTAPMAPDLEAPLPQATLVSAAAALPAPAAIVPGQFAEAPAEVPVAQAATGVSAACAGCGALFSVGPGMTSMVCPVCHTTTTFGGARRFADHPPNNTCGWALFVVGVATCVLGYCAYLPFVTQYDSDNHPRGVDGIGLIIILCGVGCQAVPSILWTVATCFGSPGLCGNPTVEEEEEGEDAPGGEELSNLSDSLSRGPRWSRYSLRLLLANAVLFAIVTLVSVLSRGEAGAFSGF